MSLGLLGEYGGSGSEISDSDEELSHPGVRDVAGEDSPTGPGPPVPAARKKEETAFLSNPMGLTEDGSSLSGDPLNQGLRDSDSESSDSGSDVEELVSNSQKPAVVLPLPDLDAICVGESSSCSVFSNPYKAAEEAKLSVLKQHVDLTESSRPEDKAKPRSRHRKRHSFPPRSEGATGHGDRLFDDRDSSIQRTEGKRKHRGGVGDHLIPTKKFMKLHQHLQAKERPWTVEPRKL